MTTTTTTRTACTRCGLNADALIHNATANGHDFTTTTRPTFTTCPPWCAGHAGPYQSWEELTDGTGHSREHSERVTSFGGVDIAVGQTEHSDGTFGAPHVEVYADDGADLTEAQAHELGMALVRAADTIRRARQEASR